jgi:hypothetical protein
MRRFRKPEERPVVEAPAEPNEVVQAIDRSAEVTQQAAAEMAQATRDLATKLQPQPRAKTFRCTVIERDEKGRIKSFDIEAK